MKSCTGNVAGQNSTSYHLGTGYKPTFLNQSGKVTEDQACAQTSYTTGSKIPARNRTVSLGSKEPETDTSVAEVSQLAMEQKTSTDFDMLLAVYSSVFMESEWHLSAEVVCKHDLPLNFSNIFKDYDKPWYWRGCRSACKLV